MIIISTYNPDRPRDTNDEEQLTAMLAAFVNYRAQLVSNINASQEEVKTAYWKSQKSSIDEIIPKVSALLGLSQTEVFDLVTRTK